MDADKLIALVRDRPALWDKSEELFKNRVLKDQAWMEIGNEFHENFNTFSPAEKIKKLCDIKNRWRGIRDSYVKYLNGSKCEAPGGKKRKYVYADNLKFLQNSKEINNTNSNFDDEGHLMEPSPDLEQYPCPETLLSYSPTPEPSSADDTKPPQRHHENTKKNASITDFQNELSYTLEPNEADQMYLLSLLPTYTQYSPLEKLQFQQCVLNFMMDKATPKTRKSNI